MTNLNLQDRNVYLDTYAWGQETLNVIWASRTQRNALIARIESSSGTRVGERKFRFDLNVEIHNFPKSRHLFEGWISSARKSGAVLAIGLAAIAR